MSTATETTTSVDSRKYLNFDEFIDYQLGKTQSRIKTTDLLTAAVAIGAILVGYLLLFVVLDQWVIADGLGYVPRLIMLTAVVGSVLGVLIWKLVIPAIKQVSMLYAAREIERSGLNMKGSLLTLVDLKQNGRISAEEIRVAMEKRAALELSHMNVDDAVDKKALLKLSYILLAIVVLFCAYALFSPKKMSTSILRALLPSADVEVATRTRIEKIEPGHTEVLVRSNLQVTADLSGEIPEQVTLLYTTSDRRFSNEPIAMRDTGEGINRFRATINGENGRGILQSFTYRVVAGDAESDVYEVRVIQPPTAIVDEVEYDYPDYMGFEDKVEPGGSIDAWEGTRVTVRATANMPVRNAMILFSDSEDTSIKAEEIAMDITDGTQLSATWRLQLRSDGSHPRFYRIQLRNDRGEQDPAPTLQPIRIREDKRPEISLIHPVADVEVPANGTLPIAFEARDPDFLLSTIDLHFMRENDEFERTRVYEGPPFESEVRGTREVTMESLNAQAGQEITFWLEAKDNLVPFGTRSENRQVTQQIKIRIIDPVPEQEAQDQLDEQRQEAQDQLDQAEQRQQPQNPQQPMDPMRDPPQDQQPMDPMQGDPMQQDPMQEGQPGEQQPMQGEGEGQPQEGQPQNGGEGNPGDPMGQPQEGDPQGMGDGGMGDPMGQPQDNMQPGDGAEGEGNPQDMNDAGMGQGERQPTPAGDDPQNPQPQGNEGQPQDGTNQSEGEGTEPQDSQPMEGQNAGQRNQGDGTQQSGDGTAQSGDSQDQENFDDLPFDEKLRRFNELMERQREREQQEQLANNDPREDAAQDPPQQQDPMQGTGAQDSADGPMGNNNPENGQGTEGQNPPSQGAADPANSGMGQAGTNDPANPAGDNPMGNDPANPNPMSAGNSGMQEGTNPPMPGDPSQPSNPVGNNPMGNDPANPMNPNGNMGQGTQPMEGAADNNASNPDGGPMPSNPNPTDGASTPMPGDPANPMQGEGPRPADNDPNAQLSGNPADQPMTGNNMGGTGDMPQEGENDPNNTTTSSNPSEDNQGMPGSEGTMPDRNPGQPGTSDPSMMGEDGGGSTPMEGQPMPGDPMNMGDGNGAGMEERPADPASQPSGAEMGETGPDGQARPTDMSPTDPQDPRGQNPNGINPEGGMNDPGMNPMEGADPGGNMGNEGTEPMPGSNPAGDANPMQETTGRPESGEPNATNPMDPANPMEGDPGNTGAGSPQMSDPMNPSSDGPGSGMSDPNGAPSETGSPSGMNDMSEGGTPSESGMGEPGNPNPDGQQPSEGGTPSESQNGMDQQGMGESGMSESGMGQTGESGMGQSGMNEGQTGMGEGQSGMNEGQTGMGQEGEGQQGMGEGQQGMGQEGQGQSGEGQGESGMGEGEGGEGQEGDPGSGSSDTNNTGNPARGLRDGAIQNGSTEPGQVTDNAAAADEASDDNLLQSTALDLTKLQDRLERGELTQQELDDLGATPDQLRQFANELEQRLKEEGNTPESAQRRDQLEQLLRDVQFDSEGDVRESGDLIDVDADGFATQRRATPSEYRAEEEAYRQRLLRQEE